MKTYCKPINYESREDMIGFLENHFKYWTMNSWNRNESYANNMKVYNLGLPREQEDKLWDMLSCEDAYWTIESLIEDFNYEHDFKYQAGFNGRSGGYLVLYNGGQKDSEYKSFCTSCGQQNYSTVEETGCRCGRCGQETRVNYKVAPKLTYTTGKGVDTDEDFEFWSDEQLRERCELVEDFDRLCDYIVVEAARLADEAEVVEEIDYVPTTRRRLKEVG